MYMSARTNLFNWSVISTKSEYGDISFMFLLYHYLILNSGLLLKALNKCVPTLPDPKMTTLIIQLNYVTNGTKKTLII